MLSIEALELHTTKSHGIRMPPPSANIITEIARAAATLPVPLRDPVAHAAVKVILTPRGAHDFAPSVSALMTALIDAQAHQEFTAQHRAELDSIVTAIAQHLQARAAAQPVPAWTGGVAIAILAVTVIALALLWRAPEVAVAVIWIAVGGALCATSIVALAIWAGLEGSESGPPRE